MPETTASANHGAETTAAPRPRRARAIVGWIVVVALVILVAAVSLRVAATAPRGHGGLDPEARDDAGALALAEILRDRGVDITVVRSRAEVGAALDGDATLVMSNPYTLTDESVLALLEPADRVVLLSTGSHLVDLLDIGADAAGSLPSAEAECAIPEFAAVGGIRPDRLFTPADGVTACFGTEDGAAVLVDERGDRRVSLVEGSRLFTNAYLAENGNAALALALLAQTDEIVWYVPSFEDSDFEGAAPDDTLGTLTPSWVTPAILLLLLSALAAMLWRGRRFGPLVAETLPVTVRASETMHGRARLTAKAGDAAHAADALRDGARRRLARRLGLADRATVDEVADAASDRLRVPRGALQGLLGGQPPANDAELVDLARGLADLERAVATASPLPGGDR